jgi:hypothetical protein
MRATLVIERPLTARGALPLPTPRRRGNDLGPFATQRNDWTAGERVARWHGEELVVVAVTAADPTDPFVGYIVVQPAA